MSNTTRLIALLATAGVLFFGTIAIKVGNYRECRAHGFSRIYCVWRH